jgi:diadenosine tetraphosphate (Ap4A) HIT family hydrolase
VKWTASDSPFICPQCGFEVYVPIAETKESVYGLYDDARFPGRGLLVVKQHFEHLDELPEDLADASMQQAITVGRILKDLEFGPRINYAVLGNEHPHVHWHIIPRQGLSDAIPTRPVWEHPQKSRKLGRAEQREIVEKIRRSLLDS